MRAFVIRGFDKKNGVDFERVHQELIAPALAAGIDGGDTTKVIVQAGSIHRDMFRELVMADIVVADGDDIGAQRAWERQAQFVADVERVLATQNNGWIDLLGTSAKAS